MIKQLLALVFLAGGLLGAAWADEAVVRNGVKAFLGEEAKIEGISRAGFLGLYEVLVVRSEGLRILYTDEQAQYFIFGSVIEAKSQTNFTEARLRKLNAISFADLPLDQAVKIVRGKGTRPLAYFADPRCQYCKRFDQELTQVDDVTVYVFLLPIIAKDSAAVSTAVWCSPDPAKAWLDLMLKNIAPTGSASCDTPLDKNLALSRKYGIKGTPTLVFADGQRLSGGMAAARLSQLLDEASAR
jgi:thiol:disulfide interchange protein DsbC